VWVYLGGILVLIKDYYKILGVDKKADNDAIKKAFRELSKKYHPDVGGSEEEFKEINEAYSVLSDPLKRKQYDNPTVGHPFRPGNPFGDMFSFRQPNPNAPRKGRPIFIEREFPLSYFIFGGIVEVPVSFTDSCPNCDGTGAEEREGCSNCGGSGHVMESKQDGNVFMQTSRGCPVCLGRGFTVVKKCDLCNGSGMAPADRVYTIDVPAGATDNYTVGLNGVGASGLHGGPAGDVVVKLHIKMPKVADLTEEQIKVLKEL
jgi:molecular chaperone DnaJ